jgi:malonyl-CoA/methylmalonyl-CoA synthetase
VVVGRPGSALDEEGIFAGLRDRLARFKQPKRVFVVDDLPRNTMAKVQKNVLRDDYAGTFDADQ